MYVLLDDAPSPTKPGTILLPLIPPPAAQVVLHFPLVSLRFSRLFPYLPTLQ